jgi:hypothetical protein
MKRWLFVFLRDTILKNEQGFYACLSKKPTINPCSQKQYRIFYLDFQSKRFRSFHSGRCGVCMRKSFILSSVKKGKQPCVPYAAKELLRESMRMKDEELLKKVIKDCLESTQYRIRQFGRTLKRWYQAILNFFELGITNALNEGKNNKAKVCKRIAYGYRNKESYIRRLYFSI